MNPVARVRSATSRLTLTLALGFLATGVWAGTAGEVTHLSGTLSVKRADGASKLLSVKSDVQEGDTLTTEQGTYARVKFRDGAEVVMRPGTELKIDKYQFAEAKPESDGMLISMLKGGLRAISGLIGKRSREKVGFSTATATIGIRGTHFGMLLCQNDCGGVATPSGQPPANGLHVDVSSGAVLVSNANGGVMLTQGQFGFVASSAAPPTLVPPQDGHSVTIPSRIGGGVGSSGGSQCTAR